MGRLAPDYIVQDGVVPRAALPAVLGRIDELSAEAGLQVANVFHAGDGNLHPLVCSTRPPGAGRRRRSSPKRSSTCCLSSAVSITGEHGVGVDKACLMPLDVLRRRPRRHGPGAPGIRPDRALQSRQGLPDAQALRRVPRSATAATR